MHSFSRLLTPSHAFSRLLLQVKIRKALGGHTLGADLLELLEGANAAGDEVVARLVSWCDGAHPQAQDAAFSFSHLLLPSRAFSRLLSPSADGWSSKIGSVDRMKGEMTEGLHNAHSPTVSSAQPPLTVAACCV